MARFSAARTIYLCIGAAVSLLLVVAAHFAGSMVLGWAPSIFNVTRIYSEVIILEAGIVGLLTLATGAFFCFLMVVGMSRKRKQARQSRLESADCNRE